MSQAVVNAHAGGFSAFSAAVAPAPEVEPTTLQVLQQGGYPKVLQQGGYPSRGLRRKQWPECGQTGAPVFDFACTLSDIASRKAFPVWPGKPFSSHCAILFRSRRHAIEWHRRRPIGTRMTVARLRPASSRNGRSARSLQKHLEEMGREHAETSETQAL
jgi:hypothetical protein